MIQNHKIKIYLFGSFCFLMLIISFIFAAKSAEALTLTLTRQLNAAIDPSVVTDDAYIQWFGSGYYGMYLQGFPVPSDGEYVRFGNADQYTYNGTTGGALAGLRFKNITIPKNANITNAYISLWGQYHNDGGTSTDDFVIYVENVINCSTYSTESNYRGRSLLGTSVAWDNVPTWAGGGGPYNTPNINSLVQAIVIRSGWSSGNALCFQIRPTTNLPAAHYRQAWGSDRTDQPTLSPKLTIVYDQTDFSISDSPDPIYAPQTGTSQASTITITSISGFNSATNLSVLPAGVYYGVWVPGLPAGATASFNTSPVTPLSNGSATSNLTVTTNNVTPGTYTLTVRGTSGAVSHDTTVTLQVVDLSVDLKVSTDGSTWSDSLSGTTLLNGVDLQATVSGTALGTILYSYDCLNSDSWIDLPATNNNPQSITDACNYSSPNTYTAKVRVQRNVANWAYDTATISVAAPTLFVNLTPTPSSGPAPLNNVSLTAIVSGTVLGSINYTFWWNCNNPSTDITTVKAACGDPDGTSGNTNGIKFDGMSPITQTVTHNYLTPNTYTAKVIAERGALQQTLSTAVTATNALPLAINLSKTEPDYCISPPAITFSWTFSDTDAGDSQKAYEVQIADNSNFINAIDSNKIYLPSTNYTASPALAYGKTYFWRVKVWDIFDQASSDWNYPPSPPGSLTASPGTSFNTPPHVYPTANYPTWIPLNPSTNETITLSPPAQLIPPVDPVWSWTISDPDDNYRFVGGTDSSSKNPLIKFSTEGQKTITLKVTDRDDSSCNCQSTPQSINIGKFNSSWKEIQPQ